MHWRNLLPFLLAKSVVASNDQVQVEVTDLQSPLLSNTILKPWHSTDDEVTADLPIVDLGYVRHQAVRNDFLPKTWAFTNIRYAAPPTGKLRFKAPQPPGKSEGIEDGAGRQMCLQADVAWGQKFPNNTEKPPPPNHCLIGGWCPPGFNFSDPKGYSEDCLHLNVFAPKESFPGGSNKKPTDLRPVLVWIYGGAFAFGGNLLYRPNELMKRSFENDRGGFVLVTINYRMGALGFAAGNEIGDEDLNAGLLDQYAALQWVQDYIKHFGGDKDQVTIAGLSAGGGSVMHHITAYQGERPAPFKRAISFSGGWWPITNKSRAHETFQTFMKEYANVSNIDELRDISHDDMVSANYRHMYDAPPGSMLYNPSHWSSFSPKSPVKLFQEGKFAKNVDILMVHSHNESAGLFDVWRNQTDVDLFIDYVMPDMPKEDREWVYSTYGRDTKAIFDVFSDAFFTCHGTHVANAIKDHGDPDQKYYRHVVNKPGHGLDMLPLFSPATLLLSPQYAHIIQDYVVTFAIDGTPSTTVRNTALSCSGVPNPPPFKEYWPDKTMQTITMSDNGKCATVNYRSPRDICPLALGETLCPIWASKSYT